MASRKSSPGGSAASSDPSDPGLEPRFLHDGRFWKALAYALCSAVVVLGGALVGLCAWGLVAVIDIKDQLGPLQATVSKLPQETARELTIAIQVSEARLLEKINERDEKIIQQVKDSAESTTTRLVSEFDRRFPAK